MTKRSNDKDNKVDINSTNLKDNNNSSSNEPIVSLREAAVVDYDK